MAILHAVIIIYSVSYTFQLWALVMMFSVLKPIIILIHSTAVIVNPTIETSNLYYKYRAIEAATKPS